MNISDIWRKNPLSPKTTSGEAHYSPARSADIFSRFGERRLLLSALSLSSKTSIEGLLWAFEALSGSQLATLPREKRILALALSHFKPGKTPLLKHFEKVIAYAQRDGNPKILDSLHITRLLDNKENFSEAAKNGYSNIVTLFLDRIDIPSDEKVNAFHNATQSRHKGIVNTLLVRCGTAISVDRKGCTLAYAAKKGHESIVNILLDLCGTEISCDFKGCALIHAAENGHEGIVNALLDRCVDTISRRDRGTVVLLASRQGYVAVIRRLLAGGPICSSDRDSAITIAGGDDAAAIRDILQYAPVIEGGLSTRGEEHLLPSIDYVREHAKELLEEFGETFPNRFRLGSAVDLGGVTKQVISTLMSSLLDKGDLKITSDGLPEPGLEENYALLGAFCSSLWKKNTHRTDRFLIGSLFDPAFFEMIQIVANAPAIAPAAAAAASAAAPSSKKAQLEAFARILKRINPSAKPYCDAYLNEDGARKAFADVIGIDISEAEEEAKGMIEPYLLTVKAFYEGTRGAFREALKTEDPKTLSQKVQGTPITKEKVLAAFTFEDGISANQISWMKEVVTEADDKALLAFVEGITGRKALSPGMRIEVAKGWRPVFEIHTCFNSLHLPTVFLSKEAFKAGVRAAVAGSGFNIA